MTLEFFYFLFVVCLFRFLLVGFGIGIDFGLACHFLLSAHFGVNWLFV